jgi:hypothetical protein
LPAALTKRRENGQDNKKMATRRGRRRIAEELVDPASRKLKS